MRNGPPEAAAEEEPMAEHPHSSVLTRQARVLVAWMGEPEARFALAGQTDNPLSAGQEAFILSARASLRARPPGINQDDLIRELPACLADHVTRLQSNPQAQPYFADGCVPALVDLSRICVIQPKIFVQHAAERVAGARADDVRSLAEVTLPVAPPRGLVPQYDAERKALITSLANPNLRIVGVFGGPAHDQPPGTVNLGFQVRLVESFVKVVSAQGRYFLHDGYHRCLGLLRRGVRYCPAFVQENVPLGALVRNNMLPFEVFAGKRPPVLPDYWDSAVSCAAWLPATRRAIIVQATEISVAG
jgi:hypothetical protein